MCVRGGGNSGIITLLLTRVGLTCFVVKGSEMMQVINALVILHSFSFGVLCAMKEAEVVVGEVQFDWSVFLRRNERIYLFIFFMFLL